MRAANEPDMNQKGPEKCRKGLMLVNVLPAFGLNEVNITTPLLRIKKISKITKKNLQLTKKYLPLQSQTKRESSLKFIFAGYKAS